MVPNACIRFFCVYVKERNISEALGWLALGGSSQGGVLQQPVWQDGPSNTGAEVVLTNFSFI